MADWFTHTVRDVITKMKDGEIVLPVIQRHFVWTEDKMELLFDSLFRKNSFGSKIISSDSGMPLYSPISRNWKAATWTACLIIRSSQSCMSLLHWFLRTFAVNMSENCRSRASSPSVTREWDVGGEEQPFAARTARRYRKRKLTYWLSLQSRINILWANANSKADR